MNSMASLARVERSLLKKNLYITKIKKGQHRFYLCNICGNGREYRGGGILVHISRSHRKEHDSIKRESMEVF